MNTSEQSADIPRGVAELVEVVQRLSLARDLATVQEIVRRSARLLTGADGATFVLRDGDRCHYADEDAIEPLWKGQRFPMSACISGWSMLNRQPAVIEDIYADDRIPHDAYRPTFVKSLVMVPIRTLDPVGAIGNYWATRHQPTAAEVRLLQALADTTAVAMENVRVFCELEDRVKARTAELQAANEQLAAANRELLAAHEQADRVFAAYAKALPGTVLDGKYRLDEELGAGGFGVVFRGRHLVLDCPVAVKVFRPASGNDSALGLQRFLREGATAARLNHPNAVRVLDSGVSTQGIAFLVMELLRGRSLHRELAVVGALPLRRCAAVAGRVADVLAAAHRQGILHRDIKPDNVFLHRTESGEEVVKVVDFGIATFFGGQHDTAAPRLTKTGEYVGTPSYVAPERMRGDPDDGRSRQGVGAAAQGDRDVDAARPDRQHGDRTHVRRVAVAAEHRLARDGELLEVDDVADADAGLGVVGAELPARALQEAVVVAVSGIVLKRLVVGVLDDDARDHPAQAHRLELQERHRAGGVLQQHLVEAQRDLVAGPRASRRESGFRDQMRRDQFLD